MLPIHHHHQTDPTMIFYAPATTPSHTRPLLLLAKLRPLKYRRTLVLSRTYACTNTPLDQGAATKHPYISSSPTDTPYARRKAEAVRIPVLQPHFEVDSSFPYEIVLTWSEYSSLTRAKSRDTQTSSRPTSHTESPTPPLHFHRKTIRGVLSPRCPWRDRHITAAAKSKKRSQPSRYARPRGGVWRALPSHLLPPPTTPHHIHPTLENILFFSFASCHERCVRTTSPCPRMCLPGLTRNQVADEAPQHQRIRLADVFPAPWQCRPIRLLVKKK